MSKFTSSSFEHIKSYELVKQTSAFVLKYQVFQVILSYVTSITQTILATIEGYPAAVDVLKFADLKFNQLLEFADSVVAYPLGFVNTYLGKFNSLYLERMKAYAPSVSVDLTSNEITNFIAITSAGYTSAKEYTFSLYSNSKGYVVKTYDSEYSKTNGTDVVRYGTAALNSGKTISNDVYTQYFKPLQTTTTNYVNDVASQTKTKADTLLQEAKKSIPTVDIKITSQAGSSTAPIVKASA